MESDYRTEIHIPRHEASVPAVQAFFGELCGKLGVPEKTRREVELALEEGLTNFFEHAIPAGDRSPVRLTLEFTEEAIRLQARAAGRPFDFSKLPQYRPLQSLDEMPRGLGTFLIEKTMDSVRWNYLEKEGQEFEMLKRLPAPIALHQGKDAFGKQENESRVQGEIGYRRLQTYEEALALASAAWDLYGYGYKDVIYYPGQVLEQCRSGQLVSWIAVDEAGSVVGHYAMMRHALEDPLGEMGAAFVLPELRKAGVFRQLSDRLHADAYRSGVRGLFSLSVTNHVATQKASEAMGRISVAIHLASTPAIFVEGAKPGDRITTVFNYHQVVQRDARIIYPPERHREMILQSYDWLGLTVSAGKNGGAHPSAMAHQDRFECHRDLAWNRAQIQASGGETVRYKLAAFTDLLVEQGVACIMLSIDIEEPGAPALAAAAEERGYFYSGISPESSPDGHDVLKLQFLNGITLDREEINLHQPSSKAILSYIEKLGVKCFT